ncbi:MULTISPECIES: phospholipase D-like domain-containing protein [unclassified Rubrivivax]|uniref:phospholipase D-like domain-containing protein n=1 Tax=unclassified Rubrivivax TaxID=2649762 RepID=UPI001E61258D|nr:MULTISPECIES: phospholipase D-like domain-containing protein [unclassified Rubrivivax]MCC9598727.1 phospholipase D-like domain-containing protein [Rubrivivax sp. JA1055]MCC9648427.1 phospholipase D-like domain-containing protein [Rubrivivax sp. JA1029]
MANDSEVRVSAGGLTLKLYRGEGACLLAFDLAAEQATRDFVGFSVEVRYPGSTRWGALRNRLHFDYPPRQELPRSYKSTEAPFQTFRWVHVPTDVSAPGVFEYRVAACYMDAAGAVAPRASVQASISLQPRTIASFLDVAFTRGFASSQAYADRFHNETGILPPRGAPGSASLQHDMSPYEAEYAWLGFEARRLIYRVLDEAAADASLTLDALIYELREPAILARLEALGPRLRAVVDDHDEMGAADSAESLACVRLAAAGARVRRLHFGRQQHHKVFVVRRDGVPVRALGGSTNFSLRGLYIQANNVLLFDGEAAAGPFGALFDACWTSPSSFRRKTISQQWHVIRNEPGSRVAVSFSPKRDASLSLAPVAQAIEQARSSVLYSVVFLNQIGGQVRQALDDLMQRSLFSYGVAQRTSGLTVHKPDGSRGLLPFAWLADNAPVPFKTEWSGDAEGQSNMVHHKFVVVDFNTENPVVFTGSSNLSAGGELDNGDHLIRLEDRSVATAYAIEALRLFDHFHFRVAARERDAQKTLRLQKPPAPGGRTWFAPYYLVSHVKERDRLLFSS